MNNETKVHSFDHFNHPKLKRLFADKEVNATIDIFEHCLDELFEIEYPWLKPDNKAFTATKRAFVKGWEAKGPFENQGVWVYYPWSKKVIHFPPENVYIRLRTSRNRNLVTEEEQAILNKKTVGIAGMSVGSNIFNTLVLTGTARHFKIADLDTISVPNLNRIFAPAHAVGQNKAIFFAQCALEVDPFLNIEVFSQGLRKQDFEKFFKQPKLDLFIEEMDNPYLKIESRKVARKNQIPVIMAADNGDGVLVDVERFDLEPEYPLFHGRLDNIFDLEKITPELSFAEKLVIIANIVHLEEATSRAQESLEQVGKTLNTWPQLGTAALEAGVSLTFIARQILLDAPMQSGRYSLSLDECFIQDHNSSSNREKRSQNTKKIMKNFLRFQKSLKFERNHR